MRTTRSWSRAASATDAAALPANAWRAWLASARRSYPVTSKPRATRFLAIGRPISPRPMTPIFFIVALLVEQDARGGPDSPRGARNASFLERAAYRQVDTVAITAQPD